MEKCRIFSDRPSYAFLTYVMVHKLNGYDILFVKQYII